RSDRLIVSGPNLAQAGDSGTGREAIGIVRHERLQQGNEVASLGARAHEAHLSAKDVPELRDLIEVSRAQDPPDRRRPRIAVGGPHGPRALLGIDRHGSKFIDLKWLPASAEPLLSIEDRAAPFQFDDQRDDGNDRKQQDHRERRRDHVEETLQLFPLYVSLHDYLPADAKRSSRPTQGMVAIAPKGEHWWKAQGKAGEIT